LRGLRHVPLAAPIESYTFFACLWKRTAFHPGFLVSLDPLQQRSFIHCRQRYHAAIATGRPKWETSDENALNQTFHRHRQSDERQLAVATERGVPTLARLDRLTADPQTGHEFSAVTGLTYNLENTDTNYKNGVDWHLDWGASQFLSKQLHIGLVGYVYNQLTGDSGAGNRVGDFKSRVIAVGPQLGYIFPVGDHQGYLNFKAYKEFDASHRADGWNAWVTFVISPAAPGEAPPTRRPIITK